MKGFLGFFKRRSKKFWIITSAIVLVLLIIIGTGGGNKYETVTVEKRDVQETVTATGNIQAKNAASLSFEASGVIGELLVEVGEGVKKGQVLARLEAGELYDAVLRARADYDSARTSLTNESQSFADQGVSNQQSLQQLYDNAPSVFSNILTSAQQSYGAFQTYYSGGSSLISEISVNLKENTSAKEDIVDAAEAAYGPAKRAFARLEALLATLPVSATREEIDDTLQKIRPELLTLRDSVSKLSRVISILDTDLVTATTIEGYRTEVAGVQDKIDLALTTELDLRNDIADQAVNNTLAYNNAQSDYRSATSALSSKQVALNVAQRRLSDTVLTSPIDGIVASGDRDVGEYVTSADEIFFVMQGDNLEVSANIPEVDIADVEAAQKIIATLDAFGSDQEFDLVITKIEPAETIIDGVVYYKTFFEFAELDPRIRPGMTVNLTMVVAEKNNVLTLPRRAITSSKKTLELEVLSGGRAQPREIEVGLKGDFYVEILSGLKLGEEVIVGEN